MNQWFLYVIIWIIGYFSYPLEKKFVRWADDEQKQKDGYK